MRTKKEYQYALDNISYNLYQAFDPDYRLEPEGIEDVDIIQELIDKCFNPKNYFKLKRSVTPKRNKKRTKEEIIKDIENETNLTFAYYEVKETKELVYCFHKLYATAIYIVKNQKNSNIQLNTRKDLSIKEVKLITELMEVLENDNNKAN